MNDPYDRRIGRLASNAGHRWLCGDFAPGMKRAAVRLYYLGVTRQLGYDSAHYRRQDDFRGLIRGDFPERRFKAVRGTLAESALD